MKKLIIFLSILVFHANAMENKNPTPNPTIEVIPALSQANDGSLYKEKYGPENSQNLCGWYTVFFLREMLAHRNNRPVLAKNMKDRALFDAFLEGLVGPGKPFEYLKKNGLEFAQKNKEFEAKKAPIREALIQAREKFPEESKEVQAQIAALDILDKSIKKEKEQWLEQNPSMTMLPDNVLQEVAKKVLGRTNNVCIFTSYGLVTDAPKILPFPIVFNTGRTLNTDHGHWIAGLFIQDGNNSKLLIADSFGAERTQDQIVIKAYNFLFIDLLIQSLTNLKQSLGNLSKALAKAGG